MRYVITALMAILISGVASDLAQAQSSSRGGSSSRPSAGSASRPRASSGRVAPVRSSFGAQPRAPQATGMLNSVRSAPSSGPGSASRSAGSSSKRLPPASSGILSATSGGTSVPTSLSSSRPSSSRRSKKSSSRSSASALPPGYRRWVDSSGRYSVKGKLAAKQDGVVWIRRTDGQLVKLPQSQLSQGDQQFLSSASAS